jgi:hypothetical protein
VRKESQEFFKKRSSENLKSSKIYDIIIIESEGERTSELQK